MPTLETLPASVRMIRLIGSEVCLQVASPAEADAKTRFRHQLEFLALCRNRLREERGRGLAGAWSYDLARHEYMLSLYRELALEALSEHLCRRAADSKTQPSE